MPLKISIPLFLLGTMQLVGGQEPTHEEKVYWKKELIAIWTPIMEKELLHLIRLSEIKGFGLKGNEYPIEMEPEREHWANLILEKAEKYAEMGVVPKPNGLIMNFLSNIQPQNRKRWFFVPQADGPSDNKPENYELAEAPTTSPANLENEACVTVWTQLIDFMCHGLGGVYDGIGSRNCSNTDAPNEANIADRSMEFHTCCKRNVCTYCQLTWICRCPLSVSCG